MLPAPHILKCPSLVWPLVRLEPPPPRPAQKGSERGRGDRDHWASATEEGVCRSRGPARHTRSGVSSLGSDSPAGDGGSAAQGDLPKERRLTVTFTLAPSPPDHKPRPQRDKHRKSGRLRNSSYRPGPLGRCPQQAKKRSGRGAGGCSQKLAATREPALGRRGRPPPSTQ